MKEKHVSVDVSHGKAYTVLDRTIIRGFVDYEVVYTATKTGDNWEFSIDPIDTTDFELMNAIREAIYQVNLEVEKTGIVKD